jgi:hypothetical protein
MATSVSLEGNSLDFLASGKSHRVDIATVSVAAKGRGTLAARAEVDGLHGACRGGWLHVA